MQDLPLIRRLELGLVAGATGLYAWRRLAAASAPGAFAEAARASGVPNPVFDREIAGYDPLLNGAVPVAAGALLLFVAWIVFHYLAVPRIRRADVPGALLSVAVTVLLAGAAVFVYYYFKRYIRLRLDDDRAILDMSVYGLYRKRLLLSEVVGIGIGFGLYEVASGAYYTLHEKLSEAYGRYFRYGSYALLAVTGGLLLSLSLIVVLPGPLWQSQPVAYLLLAAGTLLLGYALQSYLHRALPAAGVLPPLGLARRLPGYLVAALAGSLLLWGSYRGWEQVHPHPVGILFAGVAGGAAVVVYLRRGLRRENLRLQTQVSAKAAELDSLRAQINPHFLFNALNTLYASALKEGSEGTAEGIRQLAEMMRFMLEENHQQRIPLVKEVEFLRNYIDIQRLRLDETRGIDIRVNLETPPDGAGIAPMLLNPLVENAFKHGISLQNPSWIHITLALDVQHLYFRVHNSRHDRTGPDPERARPGVGQENVKKRLELLYPGRHRLDIQPTGQDYFVSLTLQYRDAHP